MIGYFLVFVIGGVVVSFYSRLKGRAKPDRITQLEADVKEIERTQKIIKKVDDLKKKISAADKKALGSKSDPNLSFTGDIEQNISDDLLETVHFKAKKKK